MIKKLLDVLSEHKDYLETLQGKVLYVADWKDKMTIALYRYQA